MYSKYFTQNTELANENTIFLVAETDGVLLGSLIAHIDYRPPVFSPQKRVFVDHVVVDEKHRGKGIFSKLQNRLDTSHLKKRILVPDRGGGEI
jgi:GNAT superfamily N-acetyltransferase